KSSEIAFGEVLESITYDEYIPKNILKNHKNTCPWEKRKKVKWKKTVTKEELDPHLDRLFFSSKNLVNANHYKDFICRTHNKLYISDNHIHFTLDIQKKGNIKARELSKLVNDLLDSLNDFGAEINFDFEVDDINIKLNLSSPGPLQLSSKNVAGIIFLIGMVGVVFTGGNFKIKNKTFEVSLETQGIIEKYNKFLNDKTRRELVKNHTDSLEIKEPEDFKKLFGEVEKSKVEHQPID
ncbi:hypothetical protein, partial [Xanthovirga aplysinae]|uniref:hypothetical protein n=1 Tax=Xanthovirga aplysinae TaxID=2529853 RepID=UPI0012BD6830